MEFLEGANLAERLEAGDLTTSETRRLLRQICGALEAAHRAGIVHRDLKPENIWVAAPAHEDSFAKVLDFGIAKLLDNPAGKSTQTGAAMGTPRYMAPEQCMGRPVDHRADIYSLGVILYEIFAGIVPFRGESFGELIYQHMSEVPEPPSRHRAIDPELERIILACLEKDPAKRPESAKELGRLLNLVLREGSGPVTQPRTAVVTARPSAAIGTTMGQSVGEVALPPPPAPKRVAALAAAGAAAVIVVVAGFLLTRNSTTTGAPAVSPAPAPPVATAPKPPPTTGHLQLHIEGGPADRVSLDGHEVAQAVSAVDFGEVAAGAHLVTIEAAGRETKNSPVTITGGAPATLSNLAPSGRAAAPRDPSTTGSRSGPGPRGRHAGWRPAGARSYHQTFSRRGARTHGRKPVPQKLMRHFSLVSLVTIGLCMVVAGGRAGAQTPPLSPAARQEAAERFDRGLRLFNQGENAGALVEFKRTYELTGDPSTLFNIGLVYAELKRPVEAVDALDMLLKSSAKLGPEQRQKAEKIRTEQWTFVSFVEVATNVQAMIEVDGVEASHTPVSGPLRLAAGHHVLGAVAAGYAPLRKTIDIAGGETQKLSFELVPGEAALGHLALHCALPAAAIWIDGTESGRTPLAATLALNPGPHHIEVRREGYRPAIADIKLDLGAVGDVTLDPQVDTAEVASSGGNLVVAVSETDALLSVDGHPPEPLAGPIRLPVGPHHLTLTRAGFEPSELDVTIARGATFNTTVNLQATADTRDAYLAHIHERRIWGWATAGVGVAALATGVALLLTGRTALNSANANLDIVDQEFARGGGGICDQSQDVSKPMCDALLADANQRVSNANARITVGYIVGGVGVAAAVVGTVVLLTGDDPDRYDRKSAASGRPTLMGWATGSSGGVVLLGRF